MRKIYRIEGVFFRSSQGFSGQETTRKIYHFFAECHKLGKRIPSARFAKAG